MVEGDPLGNLHLTPTLKLPNGWMHSISIAIDTSNWIMAAASHQTLFRSDFLRTLPGDEENADFREPYSPVYALAVLGSVQLLAIRR